MINRKVGSDLEENCRLTLAVGSTEESYKICQLGAEATIRQLKPTESLIADP
jgi:hypothetical protein